MNSMNARYFDVDNYVITAKDIRGPWSEPVYLHSSGFDASMLHDDDGRKWLVALDWETRSGYEKPGQICIVEYDPEAKKIKGIPRRIWCGATDQGCLEAPHLTKRNGWYYLMCAEGGTGCSAGAGRKILPLLQHQRPYGLPRGCVRQPQRPIREDGWFGMTEITSCGLNNGPLTDEGRYNAACCCHLTGDHIFKGKMDVRTRRTDTDTCIWEETNPTNPEWSVHYIANIQPITEVGFKYFDFHAPKAVSLRVRGEGSMKVTVKLDRKTVIGAAEAKLYGDWQEIVIPLEKAEGIHSLLFTFDTPKAQLAVR